MSWLGSLPNRRRSTYGKQTAGHCSEQDCHHHGWKPWPGPQYRDQSCAARRRHHFHLSLEQGRSRKSSSAKSKRWEEKRPHSARRRQCSRRSTDSSPKSAKRCESWGRERFDFLVNNAGNSLHANFGETTEAQFDEIVNVHFKGVYFLTQKLLPLMNDGGRIVNMSSGLARFALPGALRMERRKELSRS